MSLVWRYSLWYSIQCYCVYLAAPPPSPPAPPPSSRWRGRRCSAPRRPSGPGTRQGRRTRSWSSARSTWGSPGAPPYTPNIFIIQRKYFLNSQKIFYRILLPGRAADPAPPCAGGGRRHPAAPRGSLTEPGEQKYSISTKYSGRSQNIIQNRSK